METKQEYLNIEKRLEEIDKELEEIKNGLKSYYHLKLNQELMKGKGDE